MYKRGNLQLLQMNRMQNAAYMHACILVKGFITGKRFKYLDQAISYQECHHAHIC